MDQHDRHMPSARVVRQGGAPVAAPRVPMGARFRTVAEVAAERGRQVAVVAVGLWPLTAIVLVAGALIWSAGTAGSP